MIRSDCDSEDLPLIQPSEVESEFFTSDEQSCDDLFSSSNGSQPDLRDQQDSDDQTDGGDFQDSGDDPNLRDQADGQDPIVLDTTPSFHEENPEDEDLSMFNFNNWRSFKGIWMKEIEGMQLCFADPLAVDKSFYELEGMSLDYETYHPEFFGWRKREDLQVISIFVDILPSKKFSSNPSIEVVSDGSDYQVFGFIPEIYRNRTNYEK